MPKQVCASRKTKALPNVYLVKDLRKMAIAADHDVKVVKVMKKSELCSLLNIDWVGKTGKVKPRP